VRSGPRHPGTRRRAKSWSVEPPITQLGASRFTESKRPTLTATQSPRTRRAIVTCSSKGLPHSAEPRTAGQPPSSLTTAFLRSIAPYRPQYHFVRLLFAIRCPEQPQSLLTTTPAGSKWSQHFVLLIQKGILASFGQIRVQIPMHNSAQFRIIVHKLDPSVASGGGQSPLLLPATWPSSGDWPSTMKRSQNPASRQPPFQTFTPEID